jgi:hypothetical protein
MLQINDLQGISLNSQQKPQWAIFLESFEIITYALVIAVAAILWCVITQAIAALVWGTTSVFQQLQW